MEIIKVKTHARSWYKPTQKVGCIVCIKQHGESEASLHYAKDCYTLNHFIYCEKHKPEGSSRLWDGVDMNEGRARNA